MDSSEPLSKEQQQEPVSQLAREIAILLRPQIEGLASAVNNLSYAIKMLAPDQNLATANSPEISSPTNIGAPEAIAVIARAAFNERMAAEKGESLAGSPPQPAAADEDDLIEESGVALDNGGGEPPVPEPEVIAGATPPDVVPETTSAVGSPPPRAAADDDDLIEESDVVLDNAEAELPAPEPEVNTDAASPAATPEAPSDTATGEMVDRSALLKDTPYFRDKLRRYVAAFEAKYELTEPVTRKQLGRALEAAGMNPASAQVAISVLIKSETLFQKGSGAVVFNSTAANLAKAIGQEPEIFFKEEMGAEKTRRGLAVEVTKGSEAADNPETSGTAKDWRVTTGAFVKRVLKDRGEEIGDVIPNISAPNLQRKETWQRILSGDSMLSSSVYRAVLNELCRVYELKASRGDDFYVEAQQLIAKCD